MQDVTDLKKRYFMALGRFVHAYSLVEDAMRRLLWATAGTSQETARAVFSGVRTDTAASFIRRLYESRGEAMPKLIANCLARVVEINGIRNDVLHLGAHFNGDDFTVSNAALALPGKERITTITDSALDDLATDLHSIRVAVEVHILKPDLGTLPNLLLKRIQQVERGAWRYRRPPASAAGTVAARSQSDPTRDPSRDSQPRPSRKKPEKDQP